ncbi:hypothetical protein [Streptomyces sp. NPDC054837]
MPPAGSGPGALAEVAWAVATLAGLPQGELIVARFGPGPLVGSTV